ncbi:MAG: MFS transporter [Solirubrobacteraceae bacterium]
MATAVEESSINSRGRRRVFLYLLGAILMETLFFVVLSPLLPVYARHLHLGRVGAGVLSACYAFGYGLAAVPAGVLVGIVGQRWVSLGGLALVATGCVAFALVDQIVALDAARCLTGVGGAAVWAGSIPWLVSLGGPQDRGRMIGLAFSAASAGACAGPAVGALATVTGTRAAFLGLSVLIAALAVAGAAVSAGHEPQRPQRAPRALRRAARAPGARLALGMVVLPSVGFGVAGVLLPLRLHAEGVTEAVIAAGFLVAAGLEVVTNAAVGRWFDRRGGRRVLAATLAGSAVCAAAIALPLPAAALLVALVVSLPVIGAVWVPSLAQLGVAVERGGSQPGVALGLFNITWAVSQMVGAVGGAQLASGLGESVPFAALAGLLVLGIAGTGRLNPER